MSLWVFQSPLCVAPLFAVARDAAGSNAALVTFVIYMLAVMGLAWLSSRVRAGKGFLGEYYLGSRGLGIWAFALTFAATSSSGGSFMGFPAIVYNHGWVVALWIGGYIVVPILAMGLLSKRINQCARKTGAITIPDVLRDRFGSGALGVLATVLIVFFLTVYLIAQFKAGAKILTTLLSDQPLYANAAATIGQWAAATGLPIGSEGPGYFLSMLVFATAVIVYTTYGGFRAVVWTDVLQGFVMVGGVLIMLPLAIWLAGGLHSATEEIAHMVPPREVHAVIERPQGQLPERILPKGDWLHVADEDAAPRVYRLAEQVIFEPGERATRGRGRMHGEGEESRGGVKLIEIRTPGEVERLAAEHPPSRLRVRVLENNQGRPQIKEAAYGAESPGHYFYGPGPSMSSTAGFLPLSLAFSFFVLWTFGNAGQPSNMVRQMAFHGSRTLRYSIVTVAFYYTLIYFPIVVIFCCARVFLPGWEVDPDRVMPEVATAVTTAAGVPWLGGLLVAAPFAAVMSTVDSFLLMVSSAAVRDVYQREINPNASERTIKRLTYAVTITIGVVAVLAALYPPKFLQDIIIYGGSGLAACFLMPVALALYWPRTNWIGAFAGMLAGFLTHLALYLPAFLDGEPGILPIRIFNFDPIIPALAASFLVTIAASRITPPPPRELVKRYFYAQT